MLVDRVQCLELIVVLVVSGVEHELIVVPVVSGVELGLVGVDGRPRSGRQR